jgi:hypothetical protein
MRRRTLSKEKEVAALKEPQMAAIKHAGRWNKKIDALHGDEQQAACARRNLVRVLPFQVWREKMNATQLEAAKWGFVVAAFMKAAALTPEEAQLVKTTLQFDAAVAFVETDHAHA